MAFEQYLSETYARPAGPRAVGYVTSVVVHGPPIALFVVAWLTNALVIGGVQRDPEPIHQAALIRVPVALWRPALPGGGPKGGAVGHSAMASAAPRAGGEGLFKGLGRRQRTQPSDPETLKTASEAEAPSDYAFDGWSAPEDPALAEETGSGGLDGAGYGYAGFANGDAGDVSGDGAAEAGAGPGGPGGSSTRAGQHLAMAVPPVAKPKESRRPRDAATQAGEGQGKGGEGTGTGSGVGPGEGQVGQVEIPGPPGGPRMIKAAYLSEQMGRYLRTYETFPRLPAWAYEGKARRHVRVEVCVTTEGAVSDVRFQTADTGLQEAVGTDIRTWQYRPRIVAGTAQPFCHPIIIEYTRQIFR